MDLQLMRELEPVHQHMLALGLGALAHANWHSNYHSFENPHWADLSVLQAAHAAEILIKARIAQEHPLLIFDTLPKPDSATESTLGLKELIEEGKTFQYSELPARLWAVTGITLPNLEKYRSFGRLRNAIQHFASPQDLNVSQETVSFIYSVIDPFINSCWGLFAMNHISILSKA